MLHKKIKEIRLEAGLTQSQLAERLGNGYDKSSISKIERNKIKVGIKLLENIAKACNKELCIFFK